MRTFLVLFLLAFSLICLLPSYPVAQGAPSASALFEQWLSETNADKRAGLREKLVALGVDAVREAIARREYKKPAELGELAFKTKCPDGFERPFWIWLPDDYDGSTPAALLVCLHGGVWQAPADSGLSIAHTWERHIAQHKGPRPCIVLVPSADCYNTSANAAWWRLQGRANILHFIRLTKLKYNIDDERVFLTGFSDGGSGTFSNAFRSPDPFAGFFPMMGDPLVATTDHVQHYYSNLKGEHIYALTGGADPLYPGKEMVKLFKAANHRGADIQYTLQPKAGHVFGADPAEFDKILGIMDEWKRDSVPSELDWSSDLPELGRHHWLSIDATGELDRRANKASKPEPEGGGFRIDLGIKGPQNDPPNAAAKVAKLEKGMLGERMGMKEGDVIVGMDGHEVTCFADIRSLLAHKHPGDKITLTVQRNGKALTFEDKLDKPAKTHPGRVQAKLKPGLVSLSVYDVTRLSIWVAPGMLDKRGKLTVKLNHKKVFADVVKPDPGLVLDEYERTGDRTCPFIVRIQLDVAEALGR